MTAVAGGARHDPRILTAGMQGRRGCLQAFRGPRRPPGVLTTTAHPATTTTTSATLASTSSGERYGNSLIQFSPPPLTLHPSLFPPRPTGIIIINAPMHFYLVPPLVFSSSSSFSSTRDGVVSFARSRFEGGRRGEREAGCVASSRFAANGLKTEEIGGSFW